MPEIEFTRSFVQHLADLPEPIKKKVKRLCVYSQRILDIHLYNRNRSKVLRGFTRSEWIGFGV